MSLFVITQDHNIAQVLGTLGQRYKVQGLPGAATPIKPRSGSDGPTSTRGWALSLTTGTGKQFSRRQGGGDCRH